MDTSKLKPFDLERALAGDPVVTRNGGEVLKVVLFEKMIDHMSVAAHVNRNSVEAIYMYAKDGTYSGGINDLDLFMAPKTRTVWVNLYVSTSGTDEFVQAFSEKEADEFHSKYCKKDPRLGNRAYPIEIEE